MSPTYKFTAKLWQYSGDGAWYFITVPQQYADELKGIGTELAKGFGSIKVQARINSSAWDTSIFPDKASGSYVLPIKKAIRQKNSLVLDQDIDIEMTLKA